MLFRFGFFFCLFRLLFGSFPRARIIRTEYDREVLYFPFIAIPLLYYYIYYIPILPPFYFYIILSPPCYIIYIPPLFILSPSGLWYIVIYYITPRRRFFLFPRVYIDIILYISCLDTVFLSSSRFIMYYYTIPRGCLPFLCFRACLPSMRWRPCAWDLWRVPAGGPSWRCPLCPFGVLPGLLWRARIVGAVAVFRQRVQKYTISEKRLVLCTPLYGAFFLFWVCFPLCAFLCVLCLDAFSVGMSIFDAGRFHLCILHSLSI